MSDTNTVLNVNRLIGCTNKLSNRIKRINRRINNNNHNYTDDIDHINDFLKKTFKSNGSFIVSPYTDINDKEFGDILDDELSNTSSKFEKKLNKELHKVCLYTNNNGPKQWAKQIYKFIEQKINCKLFDTHIGAYKIDGIQIEKTRTTYNKTLSDLLTTAKIPSHAKICFIDDLYHPHMTSKNVTYIKVQPYTIELPINVITSRFCQNTRCNIPYNEFNKISR